MKILFLLSRVPFPLEKGDKLRAYHQLRVLSQEHEIYLVALSDSEVHPKAVETLSQFCKEVHILKIGKIARLWNMFLAFLSGKPIQCGYFYNSRAHRKFLGIVGRINPDHIYCQLVRVIDYVKGIDIPKTLDYQDVLSKGMLRRKELAPFFQKPLFAMEYRRLCRCERKAMSLFDNCTIITAVDRDLIPHDDKKSIHVIPNGVDLEQFANVQNSKEYDLIFAGNMNYAPNIDAAEYLVKQILPLLKNDFPTLKLAICGATPSARVKALASENVVVTGWVDSMSEYYAKSKIFIAPMRLGTGLQNKLLEAMATKLPCITSPLAGRPLENAHDGKELLICNWEQDYADAVKVLMTDAERYRQLSEAGYEFVRQNYNWESTTKKLSEIIKGKERI